MTFTLDTSGVVRVPTAKAGISHHYLWSDLTPFTQGYIEALFAAGRPLIPLRGDSQSPFRAPGFSDLAPETLARIIDDCAAFLIKHPTALALEIVMRKRGREFWGLRQGGQSPDFPPLTVTLSDDGKVAFS